MKKTIFLITSEYPFGYNETFLENEIPLLAEKYDIIIVPTKKEKHIRDLPPGVKVDDSFSLYLNNFKPADKIKIAALKVYPYLWELMSTGFKQKNIIHMLAYIYIAVSLKRWFIMDFQSRYKNKPHVFYSYWLNANAFALCHLKRAKLIDRVIARAHRFDLYEEDIGNKKIYIPFRKNIIREIDKIYCISQHGADYLKKRYKKYEKKIDISYLGVKERGFRFLSRDNETIRIVSCSNITDIKRVDFICDVIALLSLKMNKKRFEWIHIGDGPKRAVVEEKIKSYFGYSNLTCKLLGEMENEAVFELYRKLEPDLFINLSLSEGIPVSIMEALSCGIPVCATDVGGTKEIVDDMVGQLLSPFMKEEEISDVIEKLLSESREGKEKRSMRALERWRQSFNSNKNYRLFTAQIMKELGDAAQ